MTTSNDAIIELMRRHVLRDGEDVDRVKHWPDGLALTTSLRHFVAGSEAGSWTVSQEPWVDDVVIAARDDLIIEGVPERFGFLVLAGGGDVYLNDENAVAELGRWLSQGMNPIGYAEILVNFHPYSSAFRGVLTEYDSLRQAHGQSDLPDVTPLRLQQAAEGSTLTFSSFARYRRPGGLPMLDVLEWTVAVPAAGPAHWSSRKVATALRLEQAADAG